MDRSGPTSYLGEPIVEALTEIVEGHQASNTHLYDLELLIRDSGGDEEQGRDQAIELARSRVSVLVGGTSWEESVLIGYNANLLGVPYLSVVSLPPDPFKEVGAPFLFHLGPPEDIVFDRLASLMVAEGVTRATYLHRHTPTIIRIGAELPDYAERHGLTIDRIEAMDPTQSSFPDRAMEAAQEAHALVIIEHAPRAARLVEEVRAYGFTGAIYLGFQNATQTFIDGAGFAGEGVFVIGPRKVLSADKIGQSNINVADGRIVAKAGHSESSHVYSALARDAVELIHAALRDRDLPSEYQRLRDLIRTGLELRTPYTGAVGRYDFNSTDHWGLSPDELALYRVEGGRFVFVRE